MFLTLNTGNFSKDCIGIFSTVAKCNFIYTFEILYLVSVFLMIMCCVTGLLQFFGCNVGSPNRCKSEYLEFRVSFFCCERE